MAIEYAIVVRSKTRLELLTERFNTRAQSKFYIEKHGGDFSDYQAEHDTFYRSLDALQSELSSVVKYKLIDRSFLPSYIFAPNNLIVVVGQDGLVANTAKYSAGVPMVAVNPDPERYDGYLLPYNISNFSKAVKQVISGNFSKRTMRFAEANLNDGQRLLAFNDLFIGIKTHVSARYKITFDSKSEEHSSSGLIVSTPAGSTGWLSSVFNMAYGVTNLFEKNLKPKQPRLKENELLFAVREPFKSIRSQTSINAGILTNQKKLTIESLMPNNGVIFSDGIEKDFLQFNSGAIASIGLATETALLVTG